MHLASSMIHRALRDSATSWVRSVQRLSATTTSTGWPARRAEHTMLSMHRAIYFSSLCAGMAIESTGFITPNAAPQPLPEAGTRDERTLAAVGCRRLFGQHFGWDCAHVGRL